MTENLDTRGGFSNQNFSKERSLTLLRCIAELALKDSDNKVKAKCEDGFMPSEITAVDDKPLSKSSDEEFTLLLLNSKQNEGMINKLQLLICKPRDQQASKYYLHGVITLPDKSGFAHGTVSVRSDIGGEIQRLIEELNSTFNIRNMPVPPPRGISHTG